MKKFAVVLTVVAILLGCTGALYAATSIYGISGLIETPDDTIAAAKSISPAANRIFDYKPQGGHVGADLSTYGAVVGIIPNLEVGAAIVDVDARGVNSEAIVNAKYRLLAETANRPSVAVGVVDLGQRLEHFTGGAINGASAFVVIGKDITNVAEGVSGRVSKPIHGTLGIGSGLYKGLFGGLSMSAAPKLDVALEYVNFGFRFDQTFSGGLRYKPIEALTVDAGAFNFKEFYAGASYNVSTF